jgi:beta-fructofuranosidase
MKFLFVLLALGAGLLRAQAQILQTNVSLFADFEADNFGEWRSTGTAFGKGPARGALDRQQAVTGFEGRSFVNSFHGGDQATGSLTSPEFIIKEPYLNFLIGGGNHPGETCVNLLVGTNVVKSATGTEFERLQWHTWQLFPWVGQKARLEIVDRHTGAWGHINVDQITFSTRPRIIPYVNDAVTAAMVSVAATERRVAGDPQRPIYHFMAPAHWMNDPNGPMYHGRYYHIYYQYNPFGDAWGHMHWGHARSRDLVTWKHLPIALWPSKEQGEDHVFSGCMTTNASGGLMAFYTSIGRGKSASDSAQQWAAIADSDGNTFVKHPANPVLAEELHGATKVYDWRDPFIFREGGKTYLVCGGNLNQARGGQAVVLLYEATNGELTRWNYRGVLFTHPDAAVKNIECPNFFKLAGQWVLIISPHGLVEYFIGDFDPGAGRFTSRKRGLMDASRNYYAPNGLEDPQGRRILWGWVNGFPEQRGWNGCLTLPRILTIGSEGWLRQEPAPELATLRGQAFKLENISLHNVTNHLENIRGDTLELRAEFEPVSARRFGVKLRGSADGRRAVDISMDSRFADVAGARLEWGVEGSGGSNSSPVSLRVFLDRTVLEAYVNGRACATRVISPEARDLEVALFAEGGELRVRALEVWPMRSIWSQ